MAQQRHADFDQYYLIEDPKIRDSFQQIYNNTRDLQAQVEKLVDLIVNATDLANLQSTVSSEFQ
jgi:hypothetical protein